MEDDRFNVAELPFATSYHVPVLCHSVIEGLVTDLSGTYVDATLGGGGHSAALLRKLAPQGRVMGIDRDADALAEASRRLQPDLEAGRFVPVRASFAELKAALAQTGVERIHGLLLDLGVSSHQFDVPERGFSHRFDGPLDMRMDQREDVSASTVINEWEEHELVRMLFAYGEEPRARKIARAVLAERPIETTGHLARLVRATVPEREGNKTLARVFQALRIVVNRELEALERVLEDSLDVLVPGGRIAVLAYHSLEDRRVKRFFREGQFEGEAPRDTFGNRYIPLNPITRSAIVADEQEVAANPRARSARLRIAERTETPVRHG